MLFQNSSALTKPANKIIHFLHDRKLNAYIKKHTFWLLSFEKTIISHDIRSRSGPRLHQPMLQIIKKLLMEMQVHNQPCNSDNYTVNSKIY
ncbi:Uncharacterised protein [Salmonella enterica subsp. houtenae]|nr:Uncharacterised protein [Salmonella enterica subsp. houtenae]